MIDSLKIKSVTSFILLFLSLTAESTCLDPAANMFSSMMLDNIEEISAIDCIGDESTCDECLKSPSPNDYVLDKDEVRESLLNQVLSNYQSIFIDFISYEDQIKDKSFFEDCRLDSFKNENTVCPFNENKIAETRKSLERLKNSLKKSKSSESESDKITLLKLTNGKKACVDFLSGKKGSLLDSPYSHILYGYQTLKLEQDLKGSIHNDKRANSEVASYYRSIPILKYLTNTKTQETINRSIMDGSFNMDEAARLYSSGDPSDLEKSIRNKCEKIKKSLARTCSDEELYDSNPFNKNFIKKDDDGSRNYSICKANPKEKNTSDLNDINNQLKLIENPQGIEILDQIQDNLNTNNHKIDKWFEERMKLAAEDICESANSEDEEKVAQLKSDLKQVYKRAYYTPESEEVANIFIAPEKINKEVLSQKSEVKEIKKISKSKSVNSKISTAINQNNLTDQPNSTRARTMPLQTSQVLQAPVRANNTAFTDTQTRIQNAKKVSSKAINELNSLQNQNLDEIRNELNQIKSSSSNTFSSFTPQSTVINGDSSPSSISTTNKEIRILTPNEVAEIESKKAQNTENIAAKNLSAGRSIASVENNIAGQPVISFNEDYFPKQNGKELDSVNLDLVFEKHQDDIFKILKSAKGHIIFIKDPYDSDQKLKVNLLKSLADNIEDIERDPKISLVKKKNLIRMKTYVYILGRETMKFKKDLNRKIDASRFKVTQNEYDNALERFKNVSYDKLLEIIRKNY